MGVNKEGGFHFIRAVICFIEMTCALFVPCMWICCIGNILRPLGLWCDVERRIVLADVFKVLSRFPFELYGQLKASAVAERAVPSVMGSN